MLSVMRWGQLLPILASLPWLMMSYITAYQFQSFASSAGVTVGDEIRAVAVCVAVLAALALASIAYARRVRYAGWLLGAVSAAALLAFPYQFVWFTGGV